MVGVLRESAASYEARPCATGIAAVMAITHAGGLVVWKNPKHTTTVGERNLIESWVRLQVVRGRVFGVFHSCDMAGPRQGGEVGQTDDAPAT